MTKEIKKSKIQIEFRGYKTGLFYKYNNHLAKMLSPCIIFDRKCCFRRN